METSNFLKTDNNILSSKKLNSNEKYFISHILSWQNQDKVCFENSQTISDKLGLPNKRVIENIIAKFNRTFDFLITDNLIIGKRELSIDVDKLNNFLESPITVEIEKSEELELSGSTVNIITNEITFEDKIETVNTLLKDGKAAEVIPYLEDFNYDDEPSTPIQDNNGLLSLELDEKPINKTYSNETFQLANGIIVKLKNSYLDHWSEIQKKPGLMKQLLALYTQSSFDDKMNSKICDMIEEELIFSQYNNK